MPLDAHGGSLRLQGCVRWERRRARTSFTVSRPSWMCGRTCFGFSRTRKHQHEPVRIIDDLARTSQYLALYSGDDTCAWRVHVTRNVLLITPEKLECLVLGTYSVLLPSIACSTKLRLPRSPLMYLIYSSNGTVLEW